MNVNQPRNQIVYVEEQVAAVLRFMAEMSAAEQMRKLERQPFSDCQSINLFASCMQPKFHY